MKKIVFFVCIAFLFTLIPAYSIDAVGVDGLGGKTLRVRLDGLKNSNVMCNWAMGNFEFSTILFEPNDDFDWHNHTSSDSKRVKLKNGQNRFQIRSKGIGLTTIHRVSFIGGNLDLSCSPKNGDGDSPIISIEYYSKKAAKKMVAYKQKKGINAHMVKLDGHMVKLVKSPDVEYRPYYVVPENVVYYLSPFTTSFGIDVSNVK